MWWPKNKINQLVLILIFLLGILLRLYNYDKSFLFAHDQDLYSWIAKDIIVNHHWRLVGQITSVDGVFIGPLYYYLMAFFYWITEMNPMSANIPTTIIGLATIWSFYVLGNKYFNERIGIIVAFIYGLSFGAAVFDHWSVPTQPTIIWSVWFLYLILGMLKGEFKLLPWYGLLVGLTYHIHIALLPILPLPLLAYFLSEGKLADKIKKINWKKVILTIFIFFVVSSPFWLFEIKHNFSQVKSTILAMNKDLGYPTAWPKLEKVFNASSREWQQRLIFGFENFKVELIWVVMTLISLRCVIMRRINGRQAGMMFLWIFLIMLAQYTSKRQVSEYYFTNLLPIVILILGVFLHSFKYQLLLLLGLAYAGININWMVDKTDLDVSYYYRKQLVESIKADVVKNNYPCMAVNYISKFGDGVGFRYLIWNEGIVQVRPGEGVPIYNIVIPFTTSFDEIDHKYGRFGLILPPENINVNPNMCNNNEPDPLLGYTE